MMSLYRKNADYDSDAYLEFSADDGKMMSDFRIICTHTQTKKKLVEYKQTYDFEMKIVTSNSIILTLWSILQPRHGSAIQIPQT